jgi:hypothetical protein
LQASIRRKATTIAYQIYGAFSAVLLLVVIPMGVTTFGLTVAYLLTGLAGYLIICNLLFLAIGRVWPRFEEATQPPQL